MTFRYQVVRAKEKFIKKKATADDFSHILVEGENFFVGAKELKELYGQMSTIEHDLLTLASAMLAADRASERGKREEFNRKIEIEISLYNVDKFYPLLPTITRILRYLSKDAWKVSFKQTAGKSVWGNIQDSKCVGALRDGSVLLFSGGIDSLAAAIEYGAQGKLYLVSHITRNRVTDAAQTKLATQLKKGKRISGHVQVFVSSRDGGPTKLTHDAEPSQRTRSLVFMTLGAIVARREGIHQIMYMAENGQMAIHLPLSGGRIGAFSTHTAHPYVLSTMAQFLSAALGVSLKLVNPYVYSTKGEVVTHITKTMPSALPISTSCWRSARVSASGVHHCGECVPCLIRRIAIESSGSDLTKYKRNLLSEDIKRLGEDDEGRRNLVDIAEFALRFLNHSDSDLIYEFPDLISEAIDSKSAIDMYRRFAKETRKVFSGYPKLRPFLS